MWIESFKYEIWTCPPFEHYRFWMIHSINKDRLIKVFEVDLFKTSMGWTDPRQSTYLEWCHDVPFPHPKTTQLSTKNVHGTFSHFPGHDSRCVAYTKAACLKLETDGSTSTVWKTRRRNQKCWRTKSDLDSLKTSEPHRGSPTGTDFLIYQNRSQLNGFHGASPFFSSLLREFWILKCQSTICNYLSIMALQLNSTHQHASKSI